MAQNAMTDADQMYAAGILRPWIALEAIGIRQRHSAAAMAAADMHELFRWLQSNVWSNP